MFTKKDLKIGDWLVSRKGHWYQFLGNDIAVSRSDDGWCSLAEINNSFKYCSDILGEGARGLDIVKVVRPQEKWHYCYLHKDKGAVIYVEVAAKEKSNAGKRITRNSFTSVDDWLTYKQELYDLELQIELLKLEIEQLEKKRIGHKFLDFLFGAGQTHD